jgi:hypothetical protein
VIPQYNLAGREGTPADVRELLSWLTARGARPDLDVIAEGETPAGDRAATTALATRWEMPHHAADRMREVRQRLAAGPVIAA